MHPRSGKMIAVSVGGMWGESRENWQRFDRRVDSKNVRFQLCVKGANLDQNRFVCFVSFLIAQPRNKDE